MKRLSIILGIAGILLATSVVFAQAPAPSGANEEKINSALRDLSGVYGSPVVRVDQAKAICNQEQYFVDCAEIGKRYGLFTGNRAKQVDTILSELKGQVVNELKQCGDVDCLVGVATSIARRLNVSSPSVASAVDLTPQKVNDKRVIVETAKSIGVNIDDCRTMDPDTASIDLLRNCAKLAKSETVQKYISLEAKAQIEKSDTTIALKESLSKGELKCGDGTLDSCGNFCLNPSPEERREGSTAIPPVCRQIAEKFFGADGVKELEKAYTIVQQTYDTFAQKAQTLVFTTSDGQKLTDQASIGRYIEEAGKKGDVEAVTRGMDFFLKNNLITSKEKDFALSMVQKIREGGGSEGVDFDRCSSNPESCASFVPEEDRGQFAAMGQIEKIMRSEMEKRGVSDPSRCEFDTAIGESCMEAAKAALPQIEGIAGKSAETNNIVADMKQKVRFGEEAIEARKRVEKSFQSGELTIGDQKFRSMSDLESFCKTEPEKCLAETTRAGVFSRDVAAEKYQHTFDTRYNNYNPAFDAVRAPFSDIAPVVPLTAVSQTPYSNSPYSPIDREEALRQFNKWLDNPQGQPPMPTVQTAVPYSPYTPYTYTRPYRDSPYPNQPYQVNATTGVSRYPVCSYSIPSPCRTGEYRQESINEFGCNVFSACIPLATKTQPPSTDALNRQICPSLPTIDSCPAGQEKTVSFSSPECGTYYTCASIRSAESGIRFPYTLANGKIAVSLEEARAYCRQYGPGSGQGISGECEQKFGVVYSASKQNTQTTVSSATDGRSFRNGIYFSAPFTACMVRLGSGDSTTKIKDWLTQGVVPPPWSELPSKGQSDVAACERENVIPTDTWSGTDCSRYGNGWHTMDAGGNCFNPAMSEYRTTGGALHQCSVDQVYGCANSSTTSTYQTPSGQREQVWNNQGLRSWIRTDADPARIDTLKQSCVSARSQDNVWKPDAGNSQSVDFGMPDPSKCSTASSCTSTQYFNGSACSTSSYQGGSNACSSGQYWNGSSCVASTNTGTGTTASGTCSSELASLLGSGCHNMGNAWFDGGMTRYVLPNTTTMLVRTCEIASISGCAGSLSQTGQGSCGSGQYWNGSACVSSDTVGGSGCSTYVSQASCVSASSVRCDWRTSGSSGWCQSSSGTSSCGNYTCESGETTSCSADCQGATSAETCGNNYCGSGETTTTCPSDCGGYTTTGSCSSGQYWNGSSCVNSTSYSSDPSQACAQAGGTWESATNYCRMPNACTGGQYWNGSSCVGSSSYSSDPGTACAQAGGTWSSSTSYCQMPGSYQSGSGSCGSGQYWNGSSCVSSSSASSCSGGQYWNGSSCVSSPSSSCGSGQYWNGSACVATSPADTTPSCSSDQYWNGSSCVSSTPPPSEPTPPPPSEPPPPETPPISYFCPQDHLWNGSYCVVLAQNQKTIFEQSIANVISVFLNVFGR